MNTKCNAQANQYNDEATGPEFPTPAQYHMLLMRSSLLIQALESMQEIGTELMELREELSYSKALDGDELGLVEEQKLRHNITHKREQLRFAQNSLAVHKDNLKSALEPLLPSSK